MINKKALFFSIIFICTYLLPGQITSTFIRGVTTNEPSIAIDPNNPAYQFIGGNVDLYFLSDDTGKTWTTHHLTSPMGVYGDPVVNISANGRYYFAHLAKTSGKEFPAYFDRIVFQFSDNRGAKFNKGVGIGYNNGKMQDKPWFFVREISDKAKENQIAITWTEFDEYKSKNPKDSSRIRFAYSDNGGKSFSTAVTISDKQGGCMDNDETLEGATPVILSDGSIHVVWAGHDKLFYDCSYDGGKTWGKDKVIEVQTGGWDFENVKGFFRTNGMPFLKTGLNDELYLVWADKRKGSYDVYFKCSRDKGKTWEETIRLGYDKNHLNNLDLLSNNPDCFLPYMSVDPSDGTIYVVYYDRTQTEDYFTHVSLCWSENGNKFHHTRLTETPFVNAGEKVFFGDYNAVAASGGHIRAVWTSSTRQKVKLQTAGFTKDELNKYHFNPELQDTITAKIDLCPDGKIALHLLIKDFNAECKYHYHLSQGDKWKEGKLFFGITEGVFDFENIDFSKPLVLNIMILDKDLKIQSHKLFLELASN